MKLFRRRRTATTPAYPLAEAAELHETSDSSLIGPGFLDLGPTGAGIVETHHDRDRDVKELRADADYDDDGARQQLIDAERRVEEGRGET